MSSLDRERTVNKLIITITLALIVVLSGCGEREFDNKLNEFNKKIDELNKMSYKNYEIHDFYERCVEIVDIYEDLDKIGWPNRYVFTDSMAMFLEMNCKWIVGRTEVDVARGTDDNEFMIKERIKEIPNIIQDYKSAYESEKDEDNDFREKLAEKYGNNKRSKAN